MKKKIIGFHLDEESHWVAELECSHTQHVHHRPPWLSNMWVLKNKTRNKKLGTYLNCKKCDEKIE